MRPLVWMAALLLSILPTSRAFAQTDPDIFDRVGIDEERPLFGDGEAGGEVDGGRRLPDPALLVSDRDDSGHGGTPASR